MTSRAAAFQALPGAGARSWAPSPIRLGVYAALVIAPVQIAANLVDFDYGYRYAFVNPNHEQSLFAWVGAAAMIVGVAFGVALYRRTHVRAYLALTALLALIAVENRVRVAEPTVHRAIVYVPLLGGFSAALLWSARRWPRDVRRAAVAGLCLLAFSLVLHKVAPHVLLHYGYGPGTWPYEIKVSLKETGEMCGWILIATSIVAARSRRNPS